MSRIDDAFGLSAQALMLRSARGAQLAANIANAETPRYLARDFDFRTALSAAGEQFSVKPQLSHERHIDTSAGIAGFGDTLYRIPTRAASNGNTVEEEVEQAAFSENALRYQTSLQFLNGTIRTLRLALKGE